MKRPIQCIACALCLLCAWPSACQTPASNSSSVRGVNFTGLLDLYYGYNFRHPASRTNTLRYFDVKANQFSLGMLKLGAEREPDPVGFKLDTVFGRAADLLNAAEPGSTEAYKYFLEAYVSVKPKCWKGVQLDFGKFVTSAGAESAEVTQNPNYSHGLLYATSPSYHFGARLSVPVGRGVTLGYQFVNGWDNVEDNNSGKTHGVTFELATSKLKWANAYYAGPEKDNSNQGWRHFYDTVVTVNEDGNVSGLFSFDYGREINPGESASQFYGWMAAMRVPLVCKVFLSPRYEWYRDQAGLITGQAQTLQEVTLTLEYRLHKNLLSRLEYRRDWSDQPFFDRGNDTANARNQDTVLLGLVLHLGDK